MTVVDLAIVGAGIAGLAAARRAGELGLSYVIVEASDRTGGRIRSIPLDGGQWWEAGCSHLLQPPINQLIKESDRLGVGYTKTWTPPSPLWLNSEQLDNRLTDETYHQVDEAESLLRDLIETGDDSGIGELLDPNSEAFELARLLLASRFLSDPDQVSARDRFAFGSFEGEWPLQVPFSNLFERLFGEIPVRLNAPVHVVDWTGEVVRIDLGQELIECRTALVTVSTGVLSGGAIVFAPDIDKDHLAAIENLAMNSVASALLIPAVPIDMEPNTHRVILDGPLGGIEVRIRPGGRNQVTCLFTCPTNADETEIEQLLIADLSQVIPDAKFDQYDSINWTADPLVRGGWTLARPSNVDSRGLMREPLGDRVWFAGEATSPRSGGTAHGALQSGVDAVNRIASHLGYMTAEPGVVDTDDIFAFDF